MKEAAGQILRFGIVGTLATALHALVFLTLVPLLGGKVQLANLVAFLASWTTGFIGHRFFSFPAPRRAGHGLAATGLRYIQASAATFAASWLSVHLIVSMCRLPYQYSAALLVTVVPGLAFVLNKYWVFKPG